MILEATQTKSADSVTNEYHRRERISWISHPRLYPIFWDQVETIDLVPDGSKDFSGHQQVNFPAASGSHDFSQPYRHK